MKAHGCHDSRRYNAPTAEEIAFTLPNDGYGEEVASRDIVLYRGSEAFSTLPRLNVRTIHCSMSYYSF